MQIISCKNISKIYNEGTESEVQALKEISFDIEKGEKIAIVGPSGCGKSTLLHLMGCLDKPTRGKIIINGKDISELNDNELARIRREKIGFVFQFFYLIPTLTVIKNIMLPMSFEGTTKSEQEVKTLELLKIVGLEKRGDHFPSQLSGGEKQRVAIARAMANSPGIILADEPTGNLDSKSGREIIDTLLKLNKERGVTLVIITHDSYIASCAERIIYLKDGKIVKEG